ncbi:TniQ family protein [Paenibacillus guangzhouensis]|uniref:TniQ family protein n=1 Tax=Paenibacillus guangzhouensis TaxID=1473112 RepID=UPI002AB03ED9|nr:TniQ family protein [Paenibacillus guangzhouensis]
MKMESTRTLIRPFIRCNESLSGFLYRVSRMNNYRFSYLINFMNLSIYKAQNNEFQFETLQQLADLILIKSDSITEKNGYNLQSFFGSELYLKIIMKNKVKYCPICIQENHYHRTEWCFMPIHLCIKHNLLLIDECPECGHDINLRAFTNRRCEICSFSYENTASSDVIDNFIFIESQQQLTINLWKKECNVISNCNFEQFVRLAYYSLHLLIGAVDYTEMTTEKLTFFYNRSMGEKSGYKLANAFANVYWMYLDFPKHFYIVLDHFFCRNKGKHQYECLKAFDIIFYDQDFTWVQKAYNAYFVELIDEGRVRKDFSVFKRNPKLLATRQNVRSEEVRQNTGIAYEKTS